EGRACRDVSELCACLEEGAGAVLGAVELLSDGALRRLREVLRRQPPWSHYPFVLFSSRAAGAAADKAVAHLGNVTFLDRPVHVRSMLASVHTAIASRRRQYEARRAIESRDAFLAMLGHELRNPLGAVSLAVHLLGKKVPEATKLREHQVIERQSRHLSRLVDDLLDVARITHGKIVLQREKLNLVDIVRTAFETLEPRAREHRLTYDLRADEPLIWIVGDRQRLEQVFSNLLTNAIKYTPRGGSVNVSVHAERGEAFVRVRDSGVGIAAEMIGRVFDPFAQVDASLDRAQGGLGLGLALVRSVVTMHGGEVEAASDGLGSGSTFTVRLARSNEEPVDVSRATEAVVSATQRSVVIVEDNADIRELLAEILRQAGHDVTCAGDGPSGLERVLTLDPDLAFIDLGLPGFDGFELAHRLKTLGSRAHLVALTGYGQVDDRRRAIDAGFDQHLVKPVTDEDLAAALARVPSQRTTQEPTPVHVERDETP
ncbi:MAG TPA: hybrid sensor histidine kinase/response regulator, partial [Polyangiaceae bacterium]